MIIWVIFFALSNNRGPLNAFQEVNSPPKNTPPSHVGPPNTQEVSPPRPRKPPQRANDPTHKPHQHCMCQIHSHNQQQTNVRSQSKPQNPILWICNSIQHTPIHFTSHLHKTHTYCCHTTSHTKDTTQRNHQNQNT